jgi:hypothetical protein
MSFASFSFGRPAKKRLFLGGDERGHQRTEFVAVLNKQPQGGFLTRRRLSVSPLPTARPWPGARSARSGNDDFGFFFLGNFEP